MEARTLGWAGVQLRAEGSTLVLDPLQDVNAMYAAAGDLARDVALPSVMAAEPAGHAVAGLLTHLHRDHADAGALADALQPGAPVLTPADFGGDELEQAAIAQAKVEMTAHALNVQSMAPWDTAELDGWKLTALPAADGTGDPQVSWLVERGETAVLHAGDTLPHGWWWRIAQRAAAPIDVAFLPINAAVVDFPHRQPASPLPAVMGGREAAVAAALLRARRVVPIHFGAYDLPPVYGSPSDPLSELRAAASEHEVAVETPELGEWFAVGGA